MLNNERGGTSAYRLLLWTQEMLTVFRLQRCNEYVDQNCRFTSPSFYFKHCRLVAVYRSSVSIAWNTDSSCKTVCMNS